MIRRNHITRPVAWKTRGTWVVKNLLELKNARYVQIDGNLIENNWAGGQSGFAVVFTVRVQARRAPWTTIEHVRFENNVVRHSGSGINILGYDDTAPSQQVRDIVIRNNLFTDIDHRTWGGAGIFLQMGDEPADVHIEHNTVMHSGNIVSVYGGTSAAPRVAGLPLRQQHRRAQHLRHLRQQRRHRQPGDRRLLPGSVIIGNAIAGGNPQRLSGRHRVPTVANLMAQFENPAADDFLAWSVGAATCSLVQGVTGVDFDR